MSDRRPLVAGNWKMNKTGPEAREFAHALRGLIGDDAGPVDVAVCPPFTAIEAAAEAFRESAVQVLAQAVHEEASGAHTGEISAGMILAAGATGTLVGHSERRAAGETDQQVAVRVRAALDAGLAVIMCIGESLEIRQGGGTQEWLAAQIRSGLSLFDDDGFGSLAIAYEPIWAIGTGQTATPELAQEAIAHVRVVAGEAGPAEQLRILYGGSVTPDTAPALMAQADIDGALVGGASLDPESFCAIIGAA